MTDLRFIRNYLENLEFPVRGELIVDPSDSSSVIVNIDIIRNEQGRRVPSIQTLNDVRNYFLIKNISLVYILRDTVNDNLELGLRSTLMLKFDELRNIFCSTSSDGVSVWVEFKKQHSISQLKSVEIQARRYLEIIGFKLNALQSFSEQPTPSKVAILNSIRIFAPVNLSKLEVMLKEKRFVIPSTDWLRRQIDGLRKNGAIMVSQQGEISLSFGALRRLGTSKNSKSPDITRLLALANGNG